MITNNQPVSDAHTYKVFVYGTLKKGHGNNHYLKESKFLGRQIIEGDYQLYDLGYFPGLVEDEEVPISKVLGEVWEVNADTLNSLDGLEGHPHFYARKQVDTSFGPTWVYLLPPHSAGRARWAPVDTCWRPSDDEIAWLKPMRDLSALRVG